VLISYSQLQAKYIQSQILAVLAFRFPTLKSNLVMIMGGISNTSSVHGISYFKIEVLEGYKVCCKIHRKSRVSD